MSAAPLGLKDRPAGPLERLVLFLARASFYLYGALWLMGARRARAMGEVLELFST